MRALKPIMKIAIMKSFIKVSLARLHALYHLYSLCYGLYSLWTMLRLSMALGPIETLAPRNLNVAFFF